MNTGNYVSLLTAEIVKAEEQFIIGLKLKNEILCSIAQVILISLYCELNQKPGLFDKWANEFFKY